MNPPLLLFDGDCRLCVQLAAFVQRRSDGAIATSSWQEWRDANEQNFQPDTVGLVSDGVLLTGNGAWTRLLEIHPDLQGLGWLAEKLGLKGALVAAVSGAATLTKRVCGTCRLPWYLRD